LRALFADVLQLDSRTIRSDQSFVDLGGNSLSYVAMSVRLERAIGRLPADWQQRSLGELARMTPPERRSWPWLGATLETSVALRAAAILLIVGSHATLYEMWGGAHLLLGIAGYNFGRFCLTPVARTDRVRHLRKTIAWMVVPSLTWIALALPITDDYHWTNLFLVEKFFGPDHSMTAGRLWFVEVLVWTLIALTFVCWLPVADWSGAAPSRSRRGFWPSGWRCDTTCWACTSVVRRGSRSWRSGSSPSVGPRPSRRRCGSGSG
jgi:hypothetical protein